MVQYNDDVLVGATSPQELYVNAMKVLRRFDYFGVKVNHDKVVWMTSMITFLGYD